MEMMSSTASPTMEPEIWSQLPEELLDHILVFLPLKTFFNLRSTCRRFNSLIFSPFFISNHTSSSSSSSSLAPFSSFLLLSHPQFHHKFPLYDSIQRHWRMLDLSPSSYGSPTNLLSAFNGLLCFSLPTSSSSFLVCNILARSSRLIKFPIYPFSFDSISLLPSPHGYKIFILCSGSPSNSAFVYDSRAQSWTRFSGFRPIVIENSHQDGVFSNGCLYFTTPEPFSIVGFELETGNWGRPIDDLPGQGELTFVRLVSGGEGKLYLIGGIGRHGISRCLKLWEFGGERRREWVEIGRLPEAMCRKFMSVCYHNYEHVYCFSHEGMVCVCCYTWPEVLYYNVCTQTWSWFPKCPYLPEKWSCGFKWLSFVPNLYVSV